MSPDGEKAEIRITVGWRDSQENAYDLTSVSILYDSDIVKMNWSCEDGYAEGAFSTCNYNEETCTRLDGSHNVTALEWT